MSTSFPSNSIEQWPMYHISTHIHKYRILQFDPLLLMALFVSVCVCVHLFHLHRVKRRGKKEILLARRDG